MEKHKFIKLNEILNERGTLTILELPFDVKRVYSISNVLPTKLRGQHGHMILKQIFIAQSGSFTVDLNDGYKNTQVRLNKPDQALYVPAGYWRQLSDFSSDAICLVLASEHYNEKDYIYSFEDFINWKKFLSRNEEPTS